MDSRGTYAFQEVLDKGSQSRSKDLLTKMSKLIQFDDIFNLQFTSVSSHNFLKILISHLKSTYVLIAGHNRESERCDAVPSQHGE